MVRDNFSYYLRCDKDNLVKQVHTHYDFRFVYMESMLSFRDTIKSLNLFLHYILLIETHFYVDRCCVGPAKMAFTSKNKEIIKFSGK